MFKNTGSGDPLYYYSITLRIAPTPPQPHPISHAAETWIFYLKDDETVILLGVYFMKQESKLNMSLLTFKS
jgi:hypothetical protein